ncbi:MAG: hypothetical protein KF683_22310 [Rubrivivax sp.]|nr:hypothetical protein [Rubrivivax sp.]
MSRHRPTRTILHGRGALAGASLAAALLAAGCAAIQPARMQLPASLSAATPETVQGIGGGRSGSFRLGDAQGRYERRGDRLSLFETWARSSADVSYKLTRADGGEVTASCRGRQAELSAGIIAGRTQPFELVCTWRGSDAVLRLSDPGGFAGANAGTSNERRGMLTAAGAQIELRSVHRIEGSALPLAQPIGYVFSHGGREIGALEINGKTPRLWRPATGDALREPVTLAALALALLWDPGAE